MSVEPAKYVTRIYLDYQASTPMDDRVLQVMIPLMTEGVGNPSSQHWAGRRASRLLEEYRSNLANLLQVKSEDVIFTSGATESINIALLGVAKGLIKKGKHIITSQIEHKAVLETCDYLENIGFEVSYLTVDSNGYVDLSDLENAIRKDTTLITIGHANNEIGVIQNIVEIGKIAHDRGIHFFCDTAQSFGKSIIKSENLGSFAVSGHKIYGPLGVGALILKKDWQPLISTINFGGFQESGIRSGTQNLPGIAGLVKAAQLSFHEMDNDNFKNSVYQSRIKNALSKQISNIHWNGGFSNRLTGNLNFSIPTIPNELILNHFNNEFAFSSGSACMSQIQQSSHVIKALGGGEEMANSSIRVSTGRHTTSDEVDLFIEKFCEYILKISDIMNI
jgi:cysteine desulfurase